MAGGRIGSSRVCVLVARRRRSLCDVKQPNKYGAAADLVVLVRSRSSWLQPVDTSLITSLITNSRYHRKLWVGLRGQTSKFAIKAQM